MKKKPTTPKAKKTKGPVEIVAILDRSGSMGVLRNEAIAGFNKFLAEQQALPGKANLTLRLFDTEHTIPVNKVPVKDVKPLDETTYEPRGLTALNDAIGNALVALEAANPEKAIIVILTDGAENASHDFKTEQVKEKITAAEKRGWQVVYLAANQDAFAVGATMGVNAVRTANFSATAAGLATAYATTSALVGDYRTGSTA